MKNPPSFQLEISDFFLYVSYVFFISSSRGYFDKSQRTESGIALKTSARFFSYISRKIRLEILPCIPQKLFQESAKFIFKNFYYSCLGISARNSSINCLLINFSKGFSWMSSMIFYRHFSRIFNFFTRFFPTILLAVFVQKREPPRTLSGIYLEILSWIPLRIYVAMFSKTYTRFLERFLHDFFSQKFIQRLPHDFFPLFVFSHKFLCCFLQGYCQIIHDTKPCHRFNPDVRFSVLWDTLFEPDEIHSFEYYSEVDEPDSRDLFRVRVIKDCF